VAGAAVATGVLLALRGRPGRRWKGGVLGAGIATTTLVATYTGFLLPWDQLALWAVPVESNITGYRVLFRPIVRFVILDGVGSARPPSCGGS